MLHAIPEGKRLMSSMIVPPRTPTDHISFNDDGTAWWALGSWTLDDSPPVKHLDRPCGSCGGSGYVSDEMVIDAPCPDCDSTGRHTFTVEVEQLCDTLANALRCDLITFRVSVVPGMVLPIVDNSNDWEHGHIDHIDMMDETAILRTNTEGFCQDGEIITLPPAAKPGTCAVQLQVHP
jgi:hypothetical protein